MNLTDLQNKVQSMTGDVFYVAEMTDAYRVGYWKDAVQAEIREDHLLSLRVFNKDREVRLSRFDIGQPFTLRDRDDVQMPPKDENGQPMYIDEWQILDKDDKGSKGIHLVTTGGGEYEFPLATIRRPEVLIRYYLTSLTQEGESGQTYVSDWRCVTFGKREDA